MKTLLVLVFAVVWFSGTAWWIHTEFHSSWLGAIYLAVTINLGALIAFAIGYHWGDKQGWQRAKEHYTGIIDQLRRD